MVTFDLALAQLRAVAACQARAADLYKAAGQDDEARRAARYAREAQAKVDRMARATCA